jgi:hypothetical protein
VVGGELDKPSGSGGLGLAGGEVDGGGVVSSSRDFAQPAGDAHVSGSARHAEKRRHAFGGMGFTMCGLKATRQNASGDFDDVTCPKCRKEVGL